MTTATAFKLGDKVKRNNLPSWHVVHAGVIVAFDEAKPGKACVHWAPTLTKPNGVKTWLKASTLTIA